MVLRRRCAVLRWDKEGQVWPVWKRSRLQAQCGNNASKAKQHPNGCCFPFNSFFFFMFCFFCKIAPAGRYLYRKRDFTPLQHRKIFRQRWLDIFRVAAAANRLAAPATGSASASRPSRPLGFTPLKANKKHPDWGVFYLAEKEGFEPSRRLPTLRP